MSPVLAIGNTQTAYDDQGTRHEQHPVRRIPGRQGRVSRHMAFVIGTDLARRLTGSRSATVTYGGQVALVRRSAQSREQQDQEDNPTREREHDADPTQSGGSRYVLFCAIVQIG